MKKYLIILLFFSLLLCTKKDMSARVQVSTGLQYLIDQTTAGGTLTLNSDYLFKIGAGVRIDKAITIDFNGATLQFDNSFNWYDYYGDRIGMLNIEANNVTIRNGVFDLNFRASGLVDGADPTMQCLVIGGALRGDVDTVKNFTATGNTFYDIYGDGIVSSNVHSITHLIDSNFFHTAYVVENWTTAGTLGQQCIGYSSGDSITIRRNFIYGALDDAIAIHRNSKVFRCTKNYITTTGGRILVEGVTGGVIDSNYLEYIQNGASCILLTIDAGAANPLPQLVNNNVQVLDNTMIVNKGVAVAAPLLLYGAGNNITCLRNILFESDKLDAGISIKPRTWHIGLPDSVIVNGNTIEIAYNTVRNFLSPIGNHIPVDSVNIHDNIY